METRSQIELTIRAAGIAAEVLSLVKSPGKFHAQLVLVNVAKQFADLVDFVEKLPKD